MKAKFEKRAFSDKAHTSAIRYKNLHNLPHWHIEYEMVFVLEGCAELTINNRFFKITQGTCAFIGSQEIHYIKSEPQSILGIIKTDAAYVKEIVQKKHLVSPVMNMDAKEVFYGISSELKNKKEFHNIIADATVTKFIAEVFRTEQVTEYSEPAEKMTTKYKELIQMLSTNYSHMTFEDAADFMGLNKSYFSRYFYRLSGTTFSQYLNILKISAAIEKIQEKKLNMTEISMFCGFGSIRNFNRVFKALTGYNPKKLPDDYVFIYNFKDTSGNAFNPTLNCTEIME